MCQTLKTYDSLHGCYRFTVQQLLFGSFIDKCLKETDSKDRGHIYCYLLLAVRSAALNMTFVTLDVCGRSLTQLYLHSCICTAVSCTAVSCATFSCLEDLPGSSRSHGAYRTRNLSVNKRKHKIRLMTVDRVLKTSQHLSERRRAALQMQQH